MDGYRLGKFLGKGSFGDVYEATGRETGNRVAIKIVRRKRLKSRQARERIVNEVKIQCKLKHPNIVSLHTFFEDSKNVYLVMESCTNGELLKLLHDKGKMPETEAREYFRQLMEGVSYIHGNSIIHRDIKLANLLLSEDGIVKIADFGLATKVEKEDSERQTICGTPNYLSPEIAERHPHSFATDVWSLGVVLYTLLCGVPPFQDDQVASTIERVKSGQYSCPDHLSKEAVDLIQGLLKKDPKERLKINQVRKHAFLQGTRIEDTDKSLQASVCEATLRTKNPEMEDSVPAEQAQTESPQPRQKPKQIIDNFPEPQKEIPNRPGLPILPVPGITAWGIPVGSAACVGSPISRQSEDQTLEIGLRVGFRGHHNPQNVSYGIPRAHSGPYQQLNVENKKPLQVQNGRHQSQTPSGEWPVVCAKPPSDVVCMNAAHQQPPDKERGNGVHREFVDRILYQSLGKHPLTGGKAFANNHRQCGTPMTEARPNVMDHEREDSLSLNRGRGSPSGSGVTCLGLMSRTTSSRPTTDLSESCTAYSLCGSEMVCSAARSSSPSIAEDIESSSNACKCPKRGYFGGVDMGSSVSASTGSFQNRSKTINSNLSGLISRDVRAFFQTSLGESVDWRQHRSEKSGNWAASESEHGNVQYIAKLPCTDRLAPCTKSCSNGRVTLLDDGSVSIEDSKTGARILIDKSGENVGVETADNMQQMHMFPNLPEWVMQSYLQACKFVRDRSSKTPRVVYIANNGRGALMENGDTLFTFENAASTSLGIRQVRLKAGRRPEVQVSATEGGRYSIPAEVSVNGFHVKESSLVNMGPLGREAVERAMNCRDRCFKVFRQALAVKATGRKVVFPLVAKTKSSKRELVS